MCLNATIKETAVFREPRWIPSMEERTQRGGDGSEEDVYQNTASRRTHLRKGRWFHGRVERIEGPSKCLFTGLRLMPVLEWPQRSDQQGTHLSASGCVDPIKATCPPGARVCRCVCVSSKESQITRQAIFPPWGPPTSGGHSAKSWNWEKNSPYWEFSPKLSHSGPV